MPPGYVFRSEASNWRQAIGIGVPAHAMVPGPIGAFLIEHPSHGPMMIDTGMHPVCATHPRRNLGPIGAAVLKGLQVGPNENAPARLQAWGISPDDVRLVVMTHLHADHTSAMSQFRNARFLASDREWGAARSRLGARNGYARGHLPPDSRAESVAFDGAHASGPLERTLDLLGDGSVRLVSTPGHTVGHMSVLVRTEPAPTFLLGDAVYTLRNLSDDILPWRTADDGDSRDSMRQLRAFAAAHPEVSLVPTHDAEVWDALARRGPAAL